MKRVRFTEEQIIAVLRITLLLAPGRLTFTVP
jgi:hypothetical protein